jgi:hypothetical protein
LPEARDEAWGGVGVDELREIGADTVGSGTVDLRAAGEAVRGEYRCAECSYGVVVVGVLPECPMCRASSWEQRPWKPRAPVEAAPRS